MSKWTNVTGIIKANTYCGSSAKSLYYAQDTIDHLPRITGSEGSASVHVMLADGYNVISNMDNWGQRANLGNGNNGDYEYQSRVLITIDGSLRDRDFNQTLRETSRCLFRLGRHMPIDRMLVMVSGANAAGVERSYIFTGLGAVRRRGGI